MLRVDLLLATTLFHGGYMGSILPDISGQTFLLLRSFEIFVGDSLLDNAFRALVQEASSMTISCRSPLFKATFMVPSARFFKLVSTGANKNWLSISETFIIVTCRGVYAAFSTLPRIRISNSTGLKFSQSPCWSDLEVCFLVGCQSFGFCYGLPM